MTGEEGEPTHRTDGAGDPPDGERPEHSADGRPSAEQPDRRPGEDGPVGIFPSWRWLYGTVLAWFVVVVVVLYVLTVTLDHGAS